MMSCIMAVSAMAQPTARQWNSEVTAGWNLGNQMECPAPGLNGEGMDIVNPSNALKAETAWGNPVVTKSTIDGVRAAGFNAVRIPVRWQHHITNEATMAIDNAWLQRLKEIVGYCLDNDMLVIINTHHDQWLERRPTNAYKAENNRRLGQLWTNIATAFRDYDYRLAFAGTNEVHMPNNWNTPTTENQAVQNSYNQTFVDAVRSTGGNNLKRHLMVQTYNCDLAFGLRSGGFIIPTDVADNGNSYMSVEFHYYKPWDYCGGGSIYYWGNPYRTGDEQTLRNDFKRAADAWGSKGLGIIIGEWGVSNHWKTDSSMTSTHANMTYFCSTLVSEARSKGFATFVWDNGAFGNGEEKFGIFDRRNQMKDNATWITQGISQGIATEMKALNWETASEKWNTIVRNGKILITKGEEVYDLSGKRLNDNNRYYIK